MRNQIFFDLFTYCTILCTRQYCKFQASLISQNDISQLMTVSILKEMFHQNQRFLTEGQYEIRQLLFCKYVVVQKKKKKHNKIIKNACQDHFKNHVFANITTTHQVNS